MKPDPEQARKITGNVSARADEQARVAAEKGRGPKAAEEITSDFIMKCMYRKVLGDAELFKALYREHFIYNKSMGRWMQWTGHHWIIDKMDNAMASVEGVAMVYEDEARRVSQEIKEIEDKGNDGSYLKAKRKELFKRAASLRDPKRWNTCLQAVHTSRDPLAIDGNDIDQKPWLIPCANGVINLKTGELEPGRQADYLMKASPLSWPEEGIDAPCDLWEKSLSELYAGNVQLVDFWRRVCGYSLVGEVYQSVFIVMTGQGRNGKTMIVDMLTKVLGPMAGSIRPEMLLDNFNPTNSSGASADIMTLRGLRMAFASETDEGRKISPSRVKWLTGRDPIRGRNPYDKYEVEWTPSHTLILLTNHKPHAPADDFAFWERMKVIPFTLSFVDRPPTSANERQADPMLYKKLEKELPGIFAWMVRGCLEWQQAGLDPPSIVKAAVDEYQKDEDVLSDFFQECCITGPGYSVGATALYQTFESWWKENVSNKIPKQRRFGDWMKKKKFEKVKSGTIKYNGIGLLDDDGSDS